MVLRVLHSLGSDMLAEYLKKAKETPFKWLRENAEEKMNEDSQ